jgi:glycosyltransferase involved in cell wall biosynthesis
MQKSDAQPQLSIIVPMLNEADQMPDLSAHLLHWQRKGCQVVLVYGGSTDDSAKLAEWYR